MITYIDNKKWNNINFSIKKPNILVSNKLINFQEDLHVPKDDDLSESFGSITIHVTFYSVRWGRVDGEKCKYLTAIIGLIITV